MKYHVIKRSRVYRGFPYCGPASDYEDQEFDTLEEAQAAVKRLITRNPVGWDIYHNGKRVTT